MIPIGKLMAEALLSETDDGTASLSETSSDRDIYDEPWKKEKFEHPVTSVQVLDSFPSEIGRTFRSQSETKSQGWKSSPSAPHQGHFMDYQCVALNCQMVGVGPGGKRSVLARATLVDYSGRCLFDAFVRVEERVTDFRTSTTGIVPGFVDAPAAMPFGKCRHHVIKLIKNKILVGHGLKSHLSALGISHPWQDIRDTSTFYQYQEIDHLGRKCPRRLIDLGKAFLGLTAATNDLPPCPQVDARIAMGLYVRCQLEWDCIVDSHRRNAAWQPTRRKVRQAMY
eukprot:Nitzschia sp. Nitz4//scaffold61_size107673//34129//35038//NITZ4_004230-RA/size107673-augustus-gene-0.215-mRNA-1//-1//CDS//3329555695//9280//frame0